jgi:hypothetical protein
LIRPLQSCNIPAASKGRNPDISAIDDFFSSFRSLDEGCFKMPYEAIAWGIALSAGVVTIILASTALIAS